MLFFTYLTPRESILMDTFALFLFCFFLRICIYHYSQRMKGLVHKTRVAEAVIFSQKRENEQKKET